MDAEPAVGPIDALLLVSFGGPEKPDDVVPFLENVTAGRGVPRARLEQVAEHYLLFGGRSPLNDLNRDLISAIQKDFADHGIDVPVYWGNRNWDPYLRDVCRDMVDDGIRRAAYFVTSAYSSYSGCRQYRENLADATAGLPLELSRIRLYFNHPGFVTPFVEATAEAMASTTSDAHVVFVTHSIPTGMDAASGGPGAHAYRRQHEEVARLVAEGVGASNWSLAYCSRSGSPHQPWLEPDINDHLRELAADGVSSVVVVPIGFVSDHMEVVFDLDTEAKATAAELDVEFQRVATPGSHPAFVAMVRELLLERAAVDRGDDVERSVMGVCDPNPDRCADDCCPNMRLALPAVP
ncbi:MAG TPA: ferrochelatase [Aeromicrobium sp.]|nr:ferrochelatase [Aeromicrobium sp.]